ncbi:MAG: hypothetical protein K8S87_08740, partial [Planctomycetes bacterium]|nr:hypothetical protein [Planctomycetota bacterium]
LSTKLRFAHKQSLSCKCVLKLSLGTRVMVVEVLETTMLHVAFENAAFDYAAFEIIAFENLRQPFFNDSKGACN